MHSRIAKCLSLLVLGLMFAPPASAYQKMDLLKNGDFERHLYGGTVPTFWRWFTNESSGLAMSGDAYSGAYSLEFNRNGGGGAGDTVFDNWNNMVPVMPGQDYRVQFAVKGSGTMTFTHGWKDSSGNYSQTNRNITLTGTWTVYEYSTTAAANAVSSFVAFRLQPGNWCRVDAVTMWLDPGTPTFDTAFTNIGKGPVETDLTQAIGHDGNTVPVYVWEKRAMVTDPANSNYYAYFNVDDSFIYGGTNAVAVTVEYADNGYDNFTLQYDSTSSAWTNGGTVTKTGTLEWKKHTFYLSDAYFANRQQNGFADFRISDNGNGNEIISYVAVSDWNGARINENHLELGGTPTFLKMALPLSNLQSTDLSSLVNTFTGKGYNALEMNAYWFFFEPTLNNFLSMTNINNLLSTGYNAGMAMGMSFGTYPVGGGGTPDYIFTSYDSFAKDSSLNNIYDTEYGTNLPVSSIHAPGFNNRARAFMTWMLQNMDCTKLTWYETTVEPMYYPGTWCDYSANGHYDWWMWLSERYTLAYLNSLWSTAYTTYSQVPVPTSSAQAQWGMWQTFRGGSISKWVNDDIQTIRNVVGEKALVAVDVLLTDDTSDQKRFGDYNRFVNLINPDVFQVNWHWWNRSAFDRVYNACRPIARTKNIALSEHMTYNGSDFNAADASNILTHTLTAGNKFGWHLTNTLPNTGDAFTLYNSDWTPKAIIAPLDNNNAYYMNLAESYLDDPL